ncbi:MAG: hypothetical protein MI921_08615 [Cytophagales bacterium]|nr:hypothetical protein [Cytophagales bacterium]
MAKQSKTTQENNTGTEDPKLAAIKEIIFGENIKEYDKEFRSLHHQMDEQRKDLQAKIDRLKEDLNNLITETKDDFSNQLGTLRQEAFDRLTRLTEEKNQEKQSLDEMLIEVGKKLKSS